MQTNLKLGDIFPDFAIQSTKGVSSLYEYIQNDWLLFCSHPKDFTPVCTTEILQLAKLTPEFTQRNCKVAILSVDKLEDHEKWKYDIEELSGCKLDWPLIADPEKLIAQKLGIVHENYNPNATIRSVYIIGSDKKVKIMMWYPPICGRNFKEILRCLDALQINEKFGVATPADWEKGDKCLIGSKINNEDALKLFPQGFEEKKSYLRFVDLNKK